MTNEYAKAMEAAPANVNESRAGYRSDNEDFLFDIRERIGVLRKSNNGWTRELNVISWNGSAPKFDIREWDPLHEKMTKGISFTKAEAIEICKWLTERNMEPVLPKAEPAAAVRVAPKTEAENINQDPGPTGEIPF